VIVYLKDRETLSMIIMNAIRQEEPRSEIKITATARGSAHNALMIKFQYRRPGTGKWFGATIEAKANSWLWGYEFFKDAEKAGIRFKPRWPERIMPKIAALWTRLK
jgi:hypothetical protein